MMRPILLCCLLIGQLLARSQARHVPYTEVVRTFFHNYSFLEQGPVLLQFGKRPAGWTVRIVEGTPVDVRSEQLFWPLDSAAPRRLWRFDAPGTADEQKAAAESFTGTSAAYERFLFERLPFYGYDGWEEDVTNRYAQQAPLNDTLTEAVGRAYSSMGDRFLNRQSVSRERTAAAPLQARLAPLEKPSSQRIDSALYFYDHALSFYRKQHAAHPTYTSRVGNAAVKLFCEEMHAWSMLELHGYEEQARQRLQNISIDDNLRRLALNYLASCPKDAVLFTYGDNDTYPLWYLQQKERYRMDVVVINTSLAGLPYYVQYLRPKVRFSLPDKLLADATFLYVGLQESEKPSNINELFTSLTRQATEQAGLPADQHSFSFPANKFLLKVDAATARVMFPEKNLPIAGEVHWSAGGYLTLDQLLVIDVVRNNLAKRPILFTSADALHASYLIPQGAALRFVPAIGPQQKAWKAAAFRKQEAYLRTTFKPLVYAPESKSAPQSSIVSWPTSLWVPMIAYYAENDPQKALRLYNELKANHDVLRFYEPALFDLGFSLVVLGEKREAIKVLATCLKRLRPGSTVITPGLDPISPLDWNEFRTQVLDQLRQRHYSDAELQAFESEAGELFP
ncbi:MAG: hypothetical protein EOO15_13235 [Chitinophagaceae bacterium]|nr:MAG: hypothetical protein EOO15_13235 [Chitinophagaceae bacterium]